jgi:hypothetical protein
VLKRHSEIGVWLQDSPYTDNLAGQDGRNPNWKLSLLGECRVNGVTSSDC